MLHRELWKRPFPALTHLATPGAWCWVALVCGLLLLGCDKKPTRGSFVLRVVAITSGSAVVPNAAVLINGLRVGKTDNFGVYHGSFRGRVGDRVKVQVVGKGERNQFTARIWLRARKRSTGGWRLVPLQIRALLLHSNAPQQRSLAMNIRPVPMPLQIDAGRGAQPIRRSRSRRETQGNGQRRRAASAQPTDRRDSTAQGSTSPGKIPSGARKTRCFQEHRGAHRAVALHAPAGAIFSLIGDCVERVGQPNASGTLTLALPVGQFVRFMAVLPGGKSVRKVLEVTKGASPLHAYFSSGSGKCQLAKIRKKLRSRIVLEQEEIECLKKEKKGSPQHFSAWLFLGRAYCTNKKWSKGIAVLEKLRRDPRNRFNPYRALQLGIEFGRCRRYSKAIPLLKRASQQSHRMAAADRYANQKALHTALYDMYERRFHRRKRPSDLNQSLAHAKRLAEITMSRDPSACRKALKEVKRLKALVNRHGSLDE